jgi:phosphoenolpyruvate-protein phosphotransferase
MKKGVPVSPGIAVARAYCVDPARARREPDFVPVADVDAEVHRFEQACAAAARELDAAVARIGKQIGEDQAGIFRAHRALLRDPGLFNKVATVIHTRHVDAVTALNLTIDEYADLFNKLSDAYLRERLADLRDVADRIVAQLAAREPAPLVKTDEPVILVAHEILPSHALHFDRQQIAGILTETGGATGHAAILARSLGIPAVSGLPGLTNAVEPGDLIALDGREGHVYLRPGPEVEAAYRKLQREYVALSASLAENRDLPSVSPCGSCVELLANVNGPADAALAGRSGAVGVGLYRTEYVFLTHPSVPDEEEQLAAYRAVIEASPNRTVMIRTLDLGGDKQVPYLGHQGESNPFLGFRSIRLVSAYPEFFQTQLRAILRAAQFGQVGVMFPMISSLEEVHGLKKMVERTRLGLQKAGVPHADHFPIGVMLEVPAAALCIEEILEEVDFVSVGSNDLTQYLMAADRDNPRVAHLCEPFNPALMRLLSRVIKACDEHGKPVTVCGEMAARTRCFPPLFGMGLHRLSMSPAFLPSIKEMVRRTPRTLAEQIAQRVLAMRTVAEIRGYLTKKTREIWPDVKMLDVSR